MATGTTWPSTPGRPPSSDDSPQHDSFIEQQIRTTSLHVKLVELCGAMMLWMAGCLAFLLVAAMLDHWIWPLGTWGRATALAVAVVASVVYLVRAVGPLAVRKINPVYAAQAIEQSAPSLKNSLINFVTFRAHRADVRQVVYQALEQRAAADLAQVQVDHVVDHSKVIRIGYVLVAVMIVVAIYTIVSPKSTFQTAARVVAPWADIARPARVQILDIQPGDAELFQGQSIEVSARISGDILADDPVTLVFSSVDGQIVDQQIPMQPDSAGLRRVCTVPADDQGIQQDLVYRIEAGDAVSPEHSLSVLPAPTILVRRVEYDYPDYTNLPNVVDRQGDIKALEGTRVTVQAEANHTIRTAWIEFDPQSSTGRRNNRLAMEAAGKSARATFVLKLNDDRETLVHESYQVRFVTQNDFRSEHPTLHQIEVTPDLPPEISVLSPKQLLTHVAENGRVTIEVRALDPDYGLRRVRLIGERDNVPMFDETLLENVDGHQGQAILRFDFEPRKVGARVGNRISWWAEAEDNRTPDARSPLAIRSRKYQFEITAAERANGRAADDDGSQDNDHRPGGPRGNPAEAATDDSPNDGLNQDNGKPKDGADADTPNESTRSNTSQAGPQDPSRGENGDDQSNASNGDAASQDGNNGQSRRESPQEDSQDKSSGSQQSNGGSSGQQSDDQRSSQTESQQGGQSQAGQQRGSQDQGGQQHGGQNQSGGSGGKQSSNQQRGDSSAQHSDGSQSGSKSPQSGNGSNGAQSGGQGERKPGDEPLHDGEVIERVLEHMKRHEDQSQGDQSQGNQSQGNQSERNQSQGNQSEGSQSQGSQGNQGGQQSGNSGQNQRPSPSDGNAQQNQAGGSQSGGDQRASQQDAGNRNGGNMGGGQKKNEQNNNSQDSESQGGGNQSSGQQNAGNQSQASEGNRGSNSGQKQGDQQGGQTGGQQSSGQQNSASQQSQQDQQSGGSQSQSGNQSSQDQSQSGKQSGGQKSGGQKSGEKKSSGNQSSPSSGGQQQDQQNQQNGGEQKPQSGGSQGQPKKQGGGSQQKDQGKSGSQGQKPKQGRQSGGDKKSERGGSGKGNKGQSGGGQQSQKQSGSSGASDQNKDKEKKKGGGSGKDQKGGAQSPSNSPRQSDSKGGEGGDRSGGGKQGGGQGAQQPGGDRPGSQSASDQGAGTADQPGQGETGDRPGQKEVGRGDSGSPSQQRGEGSSSQQSTKSQGQASGTSPQGAQQGGSEQLPQDQTAKRQPDPRQQQGKSLGPGGSGLPTGGGKPGPQNPTQKWDLDGLVPDGERANLEYARKSTDLALEYLKDQKNNPDQQLLDELGWTPEDLRRHLDRWEQLRGAAQEDQRGAREWVEALRSLGLRPPESRLRQGAGRGDRPGGVSDTGYRSQPPARYLEQFNAYKKGTSRAE